MQWSDLVFLLPEIVLFAGASLLLLAPFVGFRREGRDAKWMTLGVLVGTAVALTLTALSTAVPSASLDAMFVSDGFASFFKILLLVIIGIVVLLSSDFLAEGKYSPWEYYSLMLFALAGMFFMASGIHLISIWIGLELMSLSSYILTGYYKAEKKSTEAAMKYFILGAMSSAILLYGVSLIYGVTGSLGLSDIRHALAAGAGQVVMAGVMLLGAGLCFKVAAVPFHAWTPDVYEGAPTPISAFLSTASKAAAFAMFARIFYEALPDIHVNWSLVIAIISAMTMIVGNVAAMIQDNVKRMLAYSSIGHAGYALLGILAMSEIGLYSVLIYMVAYAFANLGAWATVMVLQRHEYAGESVADFEGLHQRAPFYAFSMVIFLLSLGGIPPLAGFLGKYFLFAAAIQAGYAWLAVIAVLMSAVSIYYYFRIVVAMYLKEGKPAEVVITRSLRFAVAFCLVATIVLGIAAEPLIGGVRHSLQTIVVTFLR
ncbi:MAG: NADH-quinone oxidoreductase subunit N [Thermoanaerobaculia bacterium]